MRSITRILAILLLASPSVGCVMCQNCFDENFGFHGGTHPRTVPNRGRVGSRFQPAGAEHVGVAHTEEIVETPNEVPLLESGEGEALETMPPNEGSMPGDTDMPPPEMPPRIERELETRTYPRTQNRTWTNQRDYLQ